MTKLMLEGWKTKETREKIGNSYCPWENKEGEFGFIEPLSMEQGPGWSWNLIVRGESTAAVRGYRDVISGSVKELTLEQLLLMEWTIVGLSYMNSKEIGRSKFHLLSCLPVSLEETNSKPAGKGE